MGHLTVVAWLMAKIIAPIVKTAVLIQITTAAFFSEMNGVGFMTDQPHRKQYVPAKIGKDPAASPVKAAETA
jgi:hypothetical protein